jgi:hypothetical protein
VRPTAHYLNRNLPSIPDTALVGIQPLSKKDVVTVMENQSKKSHDLGIMPALVAVLLLGVVYALTAGSGTGPDALARLIAVSP